VSNEAFAFLAIGTIDVGTARAVVGRISLTGELGYEIVVAADQHRKLLDDLLDAGTDLGMRLVGDRAIDSLRLEKGYGIWSAEFRQDTTPVAAGLDRFVAYDAKDFVGAEAARRERDDPPARRLVVLELDEGDADASQDDGIWIGDTLVGVVTSGAYGHHVGASLALANVDRDVIDRGDDVTVYVIGEPRGARILPEIPYDPKGARLRA
jgi:dimethylglycine dehydrogenase